MGLRLEAVYYRVALWIGLFFWLTFDRDLAGIYLFMLVGDFLYSRLDGDISFPMVGSRSLALVVVEAAAALGIFFVVSNALMKALNPAQSVFDLWSAGTPILAGNIVLSFVGWGVFAATIESNFVGRTLDVMDGMFGPLGTKVTLSVVLALIFVAGAFTVLHLQAKALQTRPLMMTFLFFGLQALLILRQRSTLGAILMHVANNTAAVAAGFGYINL